MASKEIAAMLDELMGRNRNSGPDDKVPDITCSLEDKGWLWKLPRIGAADQ